MNFIYDLILFWRSYPALLYGIAFLLGFYCAFNPTWSLWIPLLILWIPFLSNLKPLILSISLFLAAWFFGISYYQFPTLPEEGIKGIGWVEIESLSEQHSYFGKQWLYRCRLKKFIENGSNLCLAKNIKCTISIPQKWEIHRPLANQGYIVQGMLRQSDKGSFFIKVNRNENWLALKESWSFAEFRFQAKQKASKWIKSRFSHRVSGSFLAGLATGEFDDRIMQMEFSRFGLQHLMAISGFHFSIIAAILSFFLALWVPRRLCALLIIFLLNGYFLFLGCSSSILRAWIMISIAMAGYCIKKQASGINSLGVALIGVLIVDPLLCQTMGFQFSFLATAAILLFFSPLDHFACQILPKRGLSELFEMNIWNQHAYCILSFFRQGAALAIGVNAVVLPLIFYYFNIFPLMSLFYNFFFPLFASLSMFLLLVGLILGPFGQIVHEINNIYTKWILNLIYNIPSSVDVYFEIKNIHKEFIIIHLCIIFLIGIWIRSELFRKKQESLDFVYL